VPDVTYLLEGLLRLVPKLARTDSSSAGPLLDNAAFPWLKHLSDEFVGIRHEAQKLLESIRPADSRAVSEVPVGVDGEWQLLPVIDRGGKHPYADQLPHTMAMLRRVPRLRAVDLAILNAHSTIHPHEGNNWGVLRAHLTLVEPPGSGDCHLIFPDAGVTVPWRTGEAFAFDDMYRHAAVNARAASRLVLLIEFDRPLAPIPRVVNALA
jgi:beta-hydroxylase